MHLYSLKEQNWQDISFYHNRRPAPPRVSGKGSERLFAAKRCVCTCWNVNIELELVGLLNNNFKKCRIWHKSDTLTLKHKMMALAFTCSKVRWHVLLDVGFLQLSNSGSHDNKSWKSFWRSCWRNKRKWCPKLSFLIHWTMHHTRYSNKPHT